MRHEQLHRLWIRLRLSRWLAPALCAVPYLASILWLLGKGQVWIAGVMPVRTVGASAGFVPGVETGVPETLVACPTKSSASAEYLVVVAKLRARPTIAAMTTAARMSRRPLQMTRP